MKTFITRISLLIATAFIFGYAQAAEPVRLDGAASKRTTLERILDRELNRHLSFPLAEKGDMTGEVYVSFVVDKEGGLQVLECTSTNVRLKDHVLRKLGRINVGPNPEGIWKTTHLRINFRPEKRSA